MRAENVTPPEEQPSSVALSAALIWKFVLPPYLTLKVSVVRYARNTLWSYVPTLDLDILGKVGRYCGTLSDSNAKKYSVHVQKNQYLILLPGAIKPGTSLE